MWEFCINMSDKNISSSKKIYLQIKDFCKEYGGIVTTFDRCGIISILISAEYCDESRFKHHISNILSNIICDDFKLKFLEDNLSLPSLDNMSKNAFIQALLNFDRETDIFIIQRCLIIDNSIDLDGFYYFKLSMLRDKWKELVQIANDNKAYLSSNETLVELLKFLVSNLELKNETINLMFKNNKILFYDSNNKLIKEENCFETEFDSTIISSLIALAPKYINIYESNNFNEGLINLLKQIFESRVNFLTCESFKINN